MVDEDPRAYLERLIVENGEDYAGLLARQPELVQSTMRNPWLARSVSMKNGCASRGSNLPTCRSSASMVNPWHPH